MAESTRRPPLTLLILATSALVGFLDSTIIHIKEFQSQTDPSALAGCRLNSYLDCARVTESVYSKLFGIPVSLWGMVFYQGMLLLALALLLGLPRYPWLLRLATAVVLPASVFSFYLLYMSWAGLGVFCPYCLVSNLSTTGILLAWLFFLRQPRRETTG
jgi:uncharacterized membrane protein